MARKINASGTTGTSLPGIQGPKGKTSRQTFYGSENVTDSSIGRLKISGTEKFAHVPKNTTPQEGDFVLYTENKLNSYTLYSITSSTPETNVGNFTCECTIIDCFSKDAGQESDIENINVNINVTPVTKKATVRLFGIQDPDGYIPDNDVSPLYPIISEEKDISLDTKMFNISFYSENDLSGDIKFVLEFTDGYTSPRTYSSLIYRFGAYGQTKDDITAMEKMSTPILTYRGVLDAYRNQTETSSYWFQDGRYINKVMNYTDPHSGYIPDNYCIERLDNFSITVKDFNETINGGKLFNKDVFMPAELLSDRRVCGGGGLGVSTNYTNYKIILTAYIKKTPDIYEKIFVSDFTEELKNKMNIK